MRHRLARQQGDGVLTIWNARAARYVLANPARADRSASRCSPASWTAIAPVATVVALLDTLADLIEASMPPETTASPRSRYGAGGGSVAAGLAAAWGVVSLSSSRICRRAAGASEPPGAISR